MDDNELILLVAGGDDTALRELFSRHAPWIAARLRAVLPAADVEDVVQETFLAVWRGASGYRPTGSGGGWLWGIARRQGALALRRRGTPPGALPDSVPIADPADAVAWRVDIEAAIGPAAEPDREVWQLMYVEDRPVAEVAALLGIPVGTVKSRAHRIRQLIRAALFPGSAVERSTR